MRISAFVCALLCLGSRIVGFAPREGREDASFTTMASSLTVANRILDLARERNDTITPMQLLKLVYLCHGWMLGLYGRALIDDQVQAWRYGPVVPNLYRHIRQFGSQPVAGPLRAPRGEPLDHLEADVVRQVYEQYGHMSGLALSSLTHAPSTPWHQTYDPDGWSDIISNDLIEQHYRQLAQAR